ncbi:UDP-glucose 4-epimerase family protein [Rhodoferax fermentans]|uniref:NAD-dependent dehydratase n=1 Tax=Rhodoferax fermentans TaxID=28066 RepID=A0A1T1ARB8_RHOFE|nr:SDR family oxidoreductase [Rhodoferax fermentans]MBK1683309.1 NAD-dependent dehydratase [Rhodoferax fermentans]OOV06634.1 NAD-dependent dehydratase [Rhodoferax fermentans]
MKILVTGAYGFVGKALCADLKTRGEVVVSAIRSSPVAPGVFSVGDVCGGTDWRGALEGCSAVVHLAARVHHMQDAASSPIAEFRRVNADGTLNLGRQAAAFGVRRFVFVSSIKVNGEGGSACYRDTDIAGPADAYALSKWEAEQGLCEISRQTGMEVVIIRPPLVYGPGVKANFAFLIHAVQKGWPLPLGAIRNQRSLVALDNLVDFIITCVNHPQAANQTFLISDGQDLSTTELVRAMAQAAGVPARLLPVPVSLLEWAGRLTGQEGAVQRLCGSLKIDSKKARELLGWMPKITVEEGLRRAMTGNAL